MSYNRINMKYEDGYEDGYGDETEEVHEGYAMGTPELEEFTYSSVLARINNSNTPEEAAKWIDVIKGLGQARIVRIATNNG